MYHVVQFNMSVAASLRQVHCMWAMYFIFVLQFTHTASMQLLSLSIYLITFYNYFFAVHCSRLSSAAFFSSLWVASALLYSSLLLQFFCLLFWLSLSRHVVQCLLLEGFLLNFCLLTCVKLCVLFWVAVVIVCLFQSVMLIYVVQLH